MLVLLAAGGAAALLWSRRAAAFAELPDFSGFQSDFLDLVPFMSARGIRNNNPGNIRKGNDWLGERTAQTDAAFEEFATPEYGIRALGKVLLGYQDKYGLRTVRAIISRWAPPTENNTSAYVSSVAAAMGVGADTPISLRVQPALLTALVVAIIKHENGAQPYSLAQIDAGLSMAVA
jgi:hypothetical protein